MFIISTETENCCVLFCINLGAGCHFTFLCYLKATAASPTHLDREARGRGIQLVAIYDPTTAIRGDSDKNKQIQMEVIKTVRNEKYKGKNGCEMKTRNINWLKWYHLFT